MVCEEEYELVEQIGRGSFGKVYRAQHDSGEVHAIKVVELEAAEDELESIHQEIQMLQAFNCPQLTRYHGSFIVGSSLWISMEYLEGGSLQDLMKTSKTTLDESTTQWVLREILKALVYLHLERKIHRDVKAGNILVASDGSVRLADFGESVQLTHSIAKRQTFAGSPYWMAPEVIMAQDTYNSKADIWSLGITAIEMIKGRPPFSEMHPMKAVLSIPTNPPPTLGKDGNYSKHFHSFLEHTFQRDPNLRPSAQDLLRHPFMKAARQTDVLAKLLEARRAAEMMNKLFGEGLLETAVPLAKRNTLPASATAAIAAATAAAAAATAASATAASTAAGAAGAQGCRDTDDPKTSSIEWDFGDDTDTSPPPVEPRSGLGMSTAAASAPAADVAADAARPTAAGLGQLELHLAETRSFFGKGGGRAVSPERPSPPSTEAVTPKARGGGGGMWVGRTRDGVGYGSRAPEAQPEPLTQQPRRGKMTKVGHVLGIADAEGAASLQEQMTLLSREQHERSTREQQHHHHHHQQQRQQQQQQQQQQQMEQKEQNKQETHNGSLASKPSPFAGTDSSSRTPRGRTPPSRTSLGGGIRSFSGVRRRTLSAAPSITTTAATPTSGSSAPSRGADLGSVSASAVSPAGSDWRRKDRGRSGNMFGRFLRGVTGDHGFSSPSSATSFARSLSRSSRDLGEQVRSKLSPRRVSGRFSGEQVTAGQPNGTRLVETTPGSREEPECHAHEEEGEEAEEGEGGEEEEAREGGRDVVSAASRLKQSSPRVGGGNSEPSPAHLLENRTEWQEAEEAEAVEAPAVKTAGWEQEYLEARGGAAGHVSDPKELSVSGISCGTHGGSASVPPLSIETRPAVDGKGVGSSAKTPEPALSIDPHAIIWPALPPMRWDSDSPVKRTVDSGSVSKPAASDAAETGKGGGADERAKKELEKSRSMAETRGRARREDERGGGGGKKSGSASGSSASSRDSASPAALGRGGGRRVGRTRTRGEAERSSAGAPEAKRSENNGAGGLRKTGRSRLPVPAAEDEEVAGDGGRGETVQRAGTSSATLPSWDDTLANRGTADGTPTPASVVEPTTVAEPTAVAEPAAAPVAGPGNAQGNGYLTGSNALSHALKSSGGAPSESGVHNDSESGDIAKNRDDDVRDPGFAEASGKPHADAAASGSVENESRYDETFSALAAEEVGGEDRGDSGTLRVRDSVSSDVCSRESGRGLEGIERDSRDARSDVLLATATSAGADSGLSEAEVEVAAAAATPVGDEDQDAGGDDGLTATFHAHLTPALCELWEGTEEGSDQRQAVQDLAMALERLDGCSNGHLTLHFVEAVATSCPSRQQGSAGALPSPPP